MNAEDLNPEAVSKLLKRPWSAIKRELAQYTLYGTSVAGLTGFEAEYLAYCHVTPADRVAIALVDLAKTLTTK